MRRMTRREGQFNKEPATNEELWNEIRYLDPDLHRGRGIFTGVITVVLVVLVICGFILYIQLHRAANCDHCSSTTPLVQAGQNWNLWD
jgi:hypothetical protein